MSIAKVLIAAGIYPPDAGGPAVHAKMQFERFPEFGVQTSLVALAHYRKYPQGIRHLLYLWALLKKVRNVDLVYAHDAVGVGIPALITARIFRKKFIVRIGGDVAWERKAEKLNLSMREWYEQGLHKGDHMFLLSKFLINQSDKIIVISIIQLEFLKKFYDVDQSKVVLILNPVPQVPNVKVDQEETIIFASRLTPYKNLPFVLRSLKKIFPEFPQLQMVIMGDGPERDSLIGLAKELKIEEKIIFTGNVSLDEVMRRTAACRLAIAPALTEFNPNYIVQAISYKKPFLISRENGLPFEIPESLLFDPRSETDLEFKLRTLLNPKNYEEAERYVASIDLAMSWEDNLRANVDLFKSLLNGSN